MVKTKRMKIALLDVHNKFCCTDFVALKFIASFVDESLIAF